MIAVMLGVCCLDCLSMKSQHLCKCPQVWSEHGRVHFLTPGEIVASQYFLMFKGCCEDWGFLKADCLPGFLILSMLVSLHLNKGSSFALEVSFKS